MSLKIFFDEQYLSHKPSTSERTVKLYYYSLRKFSLWLGEPAQLHHLTNKTVGLYLRSLLTESELQPTTVDKERRQLVAIWRLAHTLGLTKLGPTIAPIKIPEKIPTALTVSELHQLTLTFDSLQGETGGIPNSKLVRASFAIQWQTSERIGAVLQLKFSDIKENVITFRSETRKGGRKSRVKEIPWHVVDLINAIDKPRRKKIFPIEPSNKTKIQLLYSKLFERAGIERPKGKSTHLLRSSHATHLDIAGGDATKSLGQANRKTTEASYLDPRLKADKSCYLLPEIGATNERQKQTERQRQKNKTGNRNRTA